MRPRWHVPSGGAKKVSHPKPHRQVLLLLNRASLKLLNPLDQEHFLQLSLQSPMRHRIRLLLMAGRGDGRVSKADAQKILTTLLDGSVTQQASGNTITEVSGHPEVNIWMETDYPLQTEHL